MIRTTAYLAGALTELARHALDVLLVLFAIAVWMTVLWLVTTV